MRSARLHEFIRENLNASFRTLIDFDYLRSLRTEIAKPLSLHIAYRMFKNKTSEWEPDYKWLAEHLAIKVHPEVKRAKDQLKPALNELKVTGFLDDFEWLKGNKLRLTAGPRLLDMHKRRIQAKDAWLAFQQEKIRVEQLVVNKPARTVREVARQESFDPLAALCAEFAVRGWKGVQAKAAARGLTEETLKQEATQRGHQLKAYAPLG